MAWLFYLLEANLYLILFYGFYRLFLYKETFYILNRSYLIFSSLIAFALPFFQLGFLKTPIVLEIEVQPTSAINPVVTTSSISLENSQPSIFTIDNAVLAIYSLVVLFFLLKMVWSLSKIVKMRKLPSIQLENGVKLIDLKDSKIAFSFFNLLFLDPTLPEKNTIIKHELVHIQQKHSLDVILFEILQAINWFNPVAYFIKKDIKLIHEYLADEETTNCDVEKYDYALFLIKNSSGIQNLMLTNQIFSSSVLKKRISMLNQKKSAAWARLKLLLVLPVVAGMLCISTMAFTKNYASIDVYPQKMQTPKIITQDSIKKTDKKRPPAPLAIELRPHTNKKKPVKKNDQIKFPPPIVIPDVQTSFYPNNVYSGKTNERIKAEKRYIIINGQPVDDNSTFYGVSNTNSVRYINQTEAIRKYGEEKGKYGAVEISGNNIQYETKVSPPPPINTNNQNLKKVVLLAPPPPIKNKPKYEQVYNIDTDLDRNNGEKLITPEFEKGKKSVSIYSDRGEKVYISSDYKDDWDGKVNSYSKKPLLAGNYSYECIIAQENGAKPKMVRGYIRIK